MVPVYSLYNPLGGVQTTAYTLPKGQPESHHTVWGLGLGFRLQGIGLKEKKPSCLFCFWGLGHRVEDLGLSAIPAKWLTSYSIHGPSPRLLCFAHEEYLLEGAQPVPLRCNTPFCIHLCLIKHHDKMWVMFNVGGKGHVPDYKEASLNPKP